jgi:hypothetical protein
VTVATPIASIAVQLSTSSAAVGQAINATAVLRDAVALFSGSDGFMELQQCGRGNGVACGVVTPVGSATDITATSEGVTGRPLCR